MGTDAAGLVGVLEPTEPDVPPRPVSVLEAPAEPAIEPPAESVLPLSELPVVGAAGAVVLLPVAGVVDPPGVLVELPRSLPVPELVPVADEAGPVLDPLGVDAGTGGAALARLTEEGWVVEGTRAACLAAGRDGAGGVVGGAATTW